MKSLAQFFAYLNDIDFLYVVLRNFEHLPDTVEVAGHGDLDLLVYDLKHFEELFPSIKPVYKPPRVQYKAEMGGLNVYMDIRSVGDGYYPTHFQNNILNTREWNPKGFWTPDPIHHRLALAYHVVHHKNENTYPRHLGKATVPELLRALKESRIGYSIPQDHSVGKFNQYWKGATAVVERKNGLVSKSQVGWDNFNLLDNEERILSKISSSHFPKYLGRDEAGNVQIEDCGDRLSIDKLPDNWKAQLTEILVDLETYNVQHRDIKPDNLMVMDGVIKLIDFGWARFKSDPPDDAPQCLGFPYRPSWGPCDSFAMKKIIKEIEFKLEEAWCAFLG